MLLICNTLRPLNHVASGHLGRTSLDVSCHVCRVYLFACVQLYWFYSSFLIVFFPILKKQFAPRIVCVLQMSISSRHLVIIKSIICLYREQDVSRWSCVHPSVWTWCWSLSDRTQYIVPIEARCWNYISWSHTCPRLRTTCHFLFLPLHWSLLSAGACQYRWCFWVYPCFT